MTEIAGGDLPAGTMLPREVDLAERFEVSRGVARETIRALEERGLISVRHGKGATVTDSTNWDVLDPDVLGVLLVGSGGDELLREYLECRRVLEVEAAALAAERATDEDVANLKAALDQMEATMSQPPTPVAERAFHEADIAFHQTLIGTTGSRVLGRLVERIHSALLVARFPLARPEYRVKRGMPEHRRIYEAVEARDPDAARAAMSAHLDTTTRYLNERKRASRSNSGRAKKRGPVARKKAASEARR
ncbi:MAG: FadR family transcriptional regulator [Actinobacteria bacterium]|nr:FadR family transcriptional regulator [Actinomycetota bacterium]